MKTIYKNKKIKFLIAGLTLVLVASLGFFVQSCSQEDDLNIKSDIPILLSDYFSSPDYNELKKNFNININNIDFNSLIIDKHDDIGVSLFYLNIYNNNNQIIGQLCVAGKEGQEYNSLYEDISERISNNKGLIKIYTGKGMFVADYNFEKEKLGYRIKINNVADANSSEVRLKADVEWPSPNEPWWDCTTECYAYAKKACGDNPQCDFINDLTLGTGTACLEAACAIYCTYY